MNLAVCMAVYGKEELTLRVISQLQAEVPDIAIYVCDNLGTLSGLGPNVRCLPQGSNLGWLRGTNLAWRAARREKAYDAFVLLNNDVVLSADFLKGLWTSALNTGAAVVGPLYDDRSPYQRFRRIPAADFVGTAEERVVPYVDGTCLLVTGSACSRIGLLDEELFGFFGWGGDIDYCIRARRAGLKVVVSRRSYLNHLGRATANAYFARYKPRALGEYRRGMTKRYGRFWGRYLSFGLAGGWPALRSFATSFFPDFTLAR